MNTAASVMGLPPPATSVSGIAAAQSQNLSPTSARIRSKIPSVYPPLIEDYSTLSSSQWTLAHVLAWLTAMGFDQDVCKAFTEYDITGDALLELDAAALKDEIGITVFGKRTRLLKVIAGLKQEGEKPKEREKEKGNGTDTKAPATQFLGRAARSLAGRKPPDLVGAFTKRRRTRNAGLD
ncbi:polar growth protein [Ceratobasidium sp. 395]|nr:polar growth protein [Ceratobasidium sp. 395]